VTADLVRAPPLSVELADRLAKLEVGLDAATMVAGTTGGRAPVGPQTAADAARLHRERRAD